MSVSLVSNHLSDYDAFSSACGNFTEQGGGQKRSFLVLHCYRLHSFRSDEMGRVQDGFTIIPVYCMSEFKNLCGNAARLLFWKLVQCKIVVGFWKLVQWCIKNLMKNKMFCFLFMPHLFCPQPIPFLSGHFSPLFWFKDKKTVFSNHSLC